MNTSTRCRASRRTTVAISRSGATSARSSASTRNTTTSTAGTTTPRSRVAVSWVSSWVTVTPPTSGAVSGSVATVRRSSATVATAASLSAGSARTASSCTRPSTTRSEPRSTDTIPGTARAVSALARAPARQRSGGDDRPRGAAPPRPARRRRLAGERRRGQRRVRQLRRRRRRRRLPDPQPVHRHRPARPHGRDHGVRGAGRDDADRVRAVGRHPHRDAARPARRGARRRPAVLLDATWRLVCRTIVESGGRPAPIVERTLERWCATCGSPGHTRSCSGARAAGPRAEPLSRTAAGAAPPPARPTSAACTCPGSPCRTPGPDRCRGSPRTATRRPG